MANFSASKNTGDTLTAAEWNQIGSLNNFIQSTGQTLSIADLNQSAKAAAQYGAGNYFTDSGATNAYLLSAVGSMQSPATYFEGMEIRFRTVNANTGASTINVAALGVVDIKQTDGITDLDINDISTIEENIATYDGSVFRLQSKETYKLGSIQTFTASGTYTKSSGVRAILVELVGGGGGGGGSGSAGGSDGGAGGTTSFGVHCSATGGGGGSLGTGAGGSPGSSGGIGISGNINQKGGGGGSGSGDATSVASGGAGGSSYFGGGGQGRAAGNVGIAGGVNSGGGGSGAGGNIAIAGGGGGGAGGYSKKFITTGIGATETVTIGTAGTAGTAGTSGFTGGVGSLGIVAVYEYY